jgi:hypothetical protein
MQVQLAHELITHEIDRDSFIMKDYPFKIIIYIKMCYTNVYTYSSYREFLTPNWAQHGRRCHQSQLNNCCRPLYGEQSRPKKTFHRNSEYFTHKIYLMKFSNFDTKFEYLTRNDWRWILCCVTSLQLMACLTWQKYLPLQKVTSAQVFKEFPIFYVTGKFDFCVYQNDFHEVTFCFRHYLPYV